MENHPFSLPAETEKPEIEFVAACVSQFAQQFVQAESGSAMREIQRRNFCLGVITMAEIQYAKMGFRVVDANNIALSALRIAAPPLTRIGKDYLASSGGRQTWRNRARTLYAAVVDIQERYPLPSNRELLTSLAENDGRFYHDLSLPVA